ncbi:hypothetical protein ACFOEK_10625 [Litoribrevibacter euphylliae]|uniref:TIGR04255 family protein n=1 Tax=Litoribrevibacter euphylliae TaxID=1834034 RepID=A0ABV7HIV3_9GAMM
MGMIKNLWRGFRGGPDFTEVNHLNASLENIQFSVELPYSNIITEEPPRPIHFPFLKEGWFEENSYRLGHDQYVVLDTQLWYYVPAPIYLPNGELGVLSLSTRIKKLLKSSEVSAFDLNILGECIIEEYENYYNATPIEGDEDSFKGWNTQLRQRVRNQSEQMSSPFSEVELEEQIRLELSSFGYAPMAPHQIKTINGRSWVFCIEQQLQKRHSKDRMYCLPLSDEYYLCMRFRYRVDINEKFKLWKDHAEAAEKRIMESIKLIIPNDDLALPHQA